MSPAYSVDNATLLKILLHAAKYPYAAVNGLLLGTVRSEKAEAGNQLIVSVLDAIPLLHTFLTLTPSLETALVQVSAHVRAVAKLEVVGYYHANELLTDTELAPAARKVDNAKLSSFVQGKSTEVLQLWVKDGSKGWSRGSTSELHYNGAEVAKLFADFHSVGRHHKLYDFDDHMNDITRDYLNTDLLS